MSQVIVPPAPAGGPAASGSLGHRVASSSAAIRHYLAGSPGRLRIVSALAVLAAVGVALGGGAALRERSSALDDAKNSAAHLVLVQSVQIRLAQADADVTNSFLTFGLEPQNQQRDYLASMAVASRDLVIAANAGPEDAAALGKANTALTRYAGYIGSARANNRQGNPVGANYLTTASALLRSDAIAQLEDRSAADQAKIEAAYSRAAQAAWWLALVATIGLGILVWAGIYLARRSRRIVNLPLFAATLGLLVAVIVAAGAMGVAQSRANAVEHGALAKAAALSTSRVAAFTAKSTESLTLIARGSATEDDKDWNTLMATAKGALPSDYPGALKALTAYGEKHQSTINDLDVAGDWETAVKNATAQDAAATNALFQTYATTTATALTAAAEATSSGLNQAGIALLPAGILIFLVGLLAAIFAWWGISLRLDEYR